MAPLLVEKGQGVVIECFNHPWPLLIKEGI